MIAILAAVLAVTTAVTPSTVYSETTQPGRMVDGTDAIGLCAMDDASATRDMNRLATAALLPRGGHVRTCVTRIDHPWRVVRTVADRCMPAPGGQWCKVEAHAVVVERGGERRYAVILATEDMFD